MPDRLCLAFLIPLTPYLSPNMSSYWTSWIIVEQKTNLNLICFEFPWNIDVHVLHRQMLPLWLDFIVRAVKTASI